LLLLLFSFSLRLSTKLSPAPARLNNYAIMADRQFNNSSGNKSNSNNNSGAGNNDEDVGEFFETRDTPTRPIESPSVNQHT